MLKTKHLLTYLSLIIFMSLYPLAPAKALSGQSIRITEIMYDPSGNGSREFLELYNGGYTTINLGGWSMYGVDFVFAQGTTLAPGSYLVIARNQAALKASHPSARIVGQYGGKLRGSGELVRVLNATGQVASQVSYSFGGAWPSEPRNGGPSLSLIRPTANETLAGCWGVSTLSGGSPGFANATYGGGSCSDSAYPTPPTQPSTPPNTPSPPGTSSSNQPSSTSPTNPHASQASPSPGTSSNPTEPGTATESAAPQIVAMETARREQAAQAEATSEQTKKSWQGLGILGGLGLVVAAGGYATLGYLRSRDAKQVVSKGQRRPGNASPSGR